MFAHHLKILKAGLCCLLIIYGQDAFTSEGVGTDLEKSTNPNFVHVAKQNEEKKDLSGQSKNHKKIKHPYFYGQIVGNLGNTANIRQLKGIVTNNIGSMVVNMHQPYSGEGEVFVRASLIVGTSPKFFRASLGSDKNRCDITVKNGGVLGKYGTIYTGKVTFIEGSSWLLGINFLQQTCGILNMTGQLTLPTSIEIDRLLVGTRFNFQTNGYIVATGYTNALTGSISLIALNGLLSAYNFVFGETPVTPATTPASYALILKKLSARTSANTPTPMGSLDEVVNMTRRQAKNYPSNFIGAATLRAIATAIGFPNTNTTSSNSAPISAFVTNINMNVTVQMVTRSVDNLINSVFGYDVQSKGVKFSGTDNSTLFSGQFIKDSNVKPSSLNDSRKKKNKKRVVMQGTIGEYTILEGQLVATLFNQSSYYSSPITPLKFGRTVSNNPVYKTPATQLSIFLRAVFGISDSDYQTMIPSPVNQEDSGVVLTTIFDYVLGRNLIKPLNQFGGDGVFNRINAKSGSFTQYGSRNPITPSHFPLSTPSSYFEAIGITSSDKTHDILRLKALIQDLVVPGY
ncbi:hypothetical protein [Candidatus Finniella inopinata]|uniref:Uncharacterized protein n=1 Tax=Candidatus Finniella inopinata TaxID=1696036 RepID=A0A4Q7DGE3_9PROT|nr:hypothetical protein [Candidatus Finniella inopinata]RZI45873.1 hypothetical protein EQU50_05425 [Candidatus Finniella inopinata]